jgi:hypothetical protein
MPRRIGNLGFRAQRTVMMREVRYHGPGHHGIMSAR